MRRRHTSGDVSVRLARLAPPMLLTATLCAALAILTYGPAPTAPAWVHAPAIDIYAPEDARVEDVTVHAGQHVEPGTPLLALASAALQGDRAHLEADRAEASLRIAQWRAEQAQRAGTSRLSLSQPVAKALADAAAAEAQAEAARHSLSAAQDRVQAGLGGAEDVTRWEHEVASHRASAEGLRRLASALRAQAEASPGGQQTALDATPHNDALTAELAALDARIAGLRPQTPTAARVEAVEAVAGTFVRAGDVLVRLRPDESTRVLACGPVRSLPPAAGTVLEAQLDGQPVTLTVVEADAVQANGEGLCPVDRPMRRVVLAADRALAHGAVLSLRWPSGSP